MDRDPSTVHSHEDLAKFLAELARRTSTRPGKFENRALPTYLEAAGAWVADMDGYFHKRGEPTPTLPDWSLVASIFLAATVYE